MSRNLPPLVVEAICELSEKLAEMFPQRVRDVRIFGSVARGEAHEDSDVDVLVLLDRISCHRDRVAPMELADDSGMARGLVVHALVLSEDEFGQLRLRETGLAEDLDRDGISL